MAKIFILEDDSRRIGYFQARFGPDHILHIAKNVEEGKVIAETHGPFDIMFLDHDLAPEHYDPSIKSGDDIYAPTGYDFVKWLVSNKQVLSQFPRIIVHSLNPHGAANMVMEINMADLGCFAERIPFTSFK